MIPLIIGYLLDLIIGDPQGFFHPVRLIGKLIFFIENKLRLKCRTAGDERKAGAILWVTVVFTSFAVPFVILYVTYKINFMLAVIIECMMCYYILAARSLRDESMKVYKSLKKR